MFSGLISQTTGGKRRKRNLLLVAAAVAAVALVLVISLASRHNKQGCGSMDFLDLERFFLHIFKASLGNVFLLAIWTFKQFRFRHIHLFKNHFGAIFGIFFSFDF